MQIDFVKVRTEITSSRRDKKELPNQKGVYLLPVKINDGGFEDIEIICKMCRNLKKELREQKNVVAAVIGDKGIRPV